MPNFKDLTGQIINKWTVIGRVMLGADQGRKTMYLCRCVCGMEKMVDGTSLRMQKSKGCLKCRPQVHGQSYSIEYRLLISAKSRAKRTGIKFDLTLEDVVIPTMCPLLGIKLEKAIKTQAPASPSLDRIDPTAGYVKGNVWVISWRANWIKSNASLLELGRLVRGLRSKLRTTSTSP